MNVGGDTYSVKLKLSNKVLELRFKCNQGAESTFFS